MLRDRVGRLVAVVGMVTGLWLLAGPAAAETGLKLVLNPYAEVDWENVERHKANFHTHTTESDGRMGPDQIIQEYHDRGYGILAISDHNLTTYPWQEWGKDPAELRMLAVPGNELSRHHHTLSLFCDFVSSSRDINEVLGQVGAVEGVAVLCHPAMHWPRDNRQVPGLQVRLTPELRALTQRDFTVEAWFRTTSKGRNILMGNFAGGQGGALNLELHTDNRVRVYVEPPNGGQTVDLNVAPSALGIDTRDGEWHHLAGVRRGDVVALYLDGRLVAEKADTAGAYDLLGAAYFIGRDSRTGSTTFEGDIDDVRLWARALTGDELAAIAGGAALGRSERVSAGGLIAQYTFEPPTGAAAEDNLAVKEVADTSGSAHGPFTAVATPQGAPALTAETPRALRRSRMAVRFEAPEESHHEVPDAVVADYAQLFKDHPHLLGLEVSNGTRPLREYPLDRNLWDKLLMAKMPTRPVWGFSNDDTHTAVHLGRDWNLVLTPSLEREAVLKAVKRGSFYLASMRIHTGESGSIRHTPLIRRIEHDAAAGTITVEGYENGLPLAAEKYHWIADGKKVHTGPTLNYRRVRGIDNYVRAELVGTGGMAWTNAFGFAAR